LSEGIQRTTSEAAEAGTRAAEIVEVCLNEGTNVPESHAHLQIYLDEIRLKSEFERYKWFRPEFSLEPWISKALGEKPGSGEVGGTPDGLAIDYEGLKIWVVDLKNGQMLVKATDNAQLRLGLLGALQKVSDEGFRLDGWELSGTIIQPKIYPGTFTWKIDQPSEDFFWDSVAHHKAALVRNRDPKSQPCPGDHCTFCPAGGANKCPAQTKAVLAAIPDPEIDPVKSAEDMPIEKLAEIFKAKTLINKFLETAGKRLAKELDANDGILKSCGIKKVRTNGRRGWKKDAVEAIVKAAGAQGEDLVEQKLIGLTDAQRIVGKAFVDKWTEKSRGGTAIVDINDKRLPYSGGVDLNAIPDAEE